MTVNGGCSTGDRFRRSEGPDTGGSSDGRGRRAVLGMVMFGSSNTGPKEEEEEEEEEHQWQYGQK